MHTKMQFLALITCKLKGQTVVTFVGYNNRDKLKEGVMRDAWLVSSISFLLICFSYIIWIWIQDIGGKLNWNRRQEGLLEYEWKWRQLGHDLRILTEMWRGGKQRSKRQERESWTNSCNTYRAGKQRLLFLLLGTLCLEQRVSALQMSLFA